MIATRRRLLRQLGGFAVGATALIAAPRLVTAATDARRLSFHNIHNEERLTAVYWSDGGYDQGALNEIDFALRDHVPNEFVRVNPLGLQIAYFRVDQAFEEAAR